MKTPLILAGMLFMTAAIAQITIGKQTVDGDGLLDFPTGTTKGIILPHTQTMTGMVAGTLTFDMGSKNVRYYDGLAWIDMYTELGDAIGLPSTAEEIQEGVIIGAETSTAPGVLVLESDSKALILPKIADPHLSVVNPEPGMICYDTASKSVAVFNGLVWAYWE